MNKPRTCGFTPRLLTARLFFLFLLPLLGCATKLTKDGSIPISKFVLSEPMPGTYTPYNPRIKKLRFYAGEILIINSSAFIYNWFSDSSADARPDLSGSFWVSENHIHLENPKVPFPDRITGIADGVSAIMTPEAYEKWKKTGTARGGEILYLEK